MTTPRHYRLKRALHAGFRTLSRVFPPAEPWAARLARRALLFAFTDTSGYFAQWGQDTFIDQCLFGERRNGVFVDIGANDGVSLSNTCFFEKARGWTGLCVEPQPQVFALLQSRRSCRCIQGCAGTADGTVSFSSMTGEGNLLSGRPELFPEGHLDRMAANARADGVAIETIEVPCYEINGLIRRQGIETFDLLSMDTEGGEHDLLRALDIERFRIQVIAVENNYSDRRIEQLLDARGFRLVACMGSDEIYVRRDFKTSIA